MSGRRYYFSTLSHTKHLTRYTPRPAILVRLLYPTNEPQLVGSISETNHVTHQAPYKLGSNHVVNYVFALPYWKYKGGIRRSTFAGWSPYFLYWWSANLARWSVNLARWLAEENQSNGWLILTKIFWENFHQSNDNGKYYHPKWKWSNSLVLKT